MQPWLVKEISLSLCGVCRTSLWKLLISVSRDSKASTAPPPCSYRHTQRHKLRLTHMHDRSLSWAFVGDIRAASRVCVWCMNGSRRPLTCSSSEGPLGGTMPYFLTSFSMRATVSAGSDTSLTHTHETHTPHQLPHSLAPEGTSNP